MTTRTLTIEDTNLSRAWARAFIEATQPGVCELSPLQVTVTGLVDGKPGEMPPIRDALDAALDSRGEKQSSTVANTIFPQSLWNPRHDRDRLYNRYHDVLRDIKTGEGCNKYGIYFERLIAFGPDKMNQLEHIIETYGRGNHRRSALQVGIFDPKHDHTHQRQRGFPCLQQIAFTPFGDGELAISAFYATQYLFEKAYGNYLGLCNLGRFVAHELGLQLTRMTCFAGVATLGDTGRTELKALARQIEGALCPLDVEQDLVDSHGR